MGFILKPYEVHVSGFSPVFYAAASPGKARAAAWRDYSECRGTGFREFMSLSTVRRVSPPPHFGDPIMVGGMPAYFVSGGHHSHYVRFVRPDSSVILYSHPNDVCFRDYTLQDLRWMSDCARPALIATGQYCEDRFALADGDETIYAPPWLMHPEAAHERLCSYASPLPGTWLVWSRDPMTGEEDCEPAIVALEQHEFWATFEPTPEDIGDPA